MRNDKKGVIVNGSKIISYTIQCNHCGMHWDESMTHVHGGICNECDGHYCNKEWCRHECVPIEVRLRIEEGSKHSEDLFKKGLLDARIQTINKDANGEEFHAFNEKLIHKPA
jgi:hypothetical protein